MKVLSFTQLQEEYGITYSRQHLGRLEKAGKFPKRIHLTERRVVWAASEIEEWLVSKGVPRDLLDAKTKFS